MIYSAIARSVGSERRIAPIRRIGTPHRDGMPPTGAPAAGAPAATSM
jgi:hypothetical protein